MIEPMITEKSNTKPRTVMYRCCFYHSFQQTPLFSLAPTIHDKASDFNLSLDYLDWTYMISVGNFDQAIDIWHIPGAVGTGSRGLRGADHTIKHECVRRNRPHGRSRRPPSS